MRLKDGTFLLRVSTDPDTRAWQCLVRHLTSGRETHIRGGRAASAFVKACVLQAPVPTSTAKAEEVDTSKLTEDESDSGAQYGEET
ncbi:MAG: hypothetical protein NVS4B11_29430 [Ktedonobacteraceae bacterium]